MVVSIGMRTSGYTALCLPTAVHYYLITTYNNAPYLAAMLASVCGQYKTPGDFHREAKVFFVDDASTDNSIETITLLQSCHPNLRVSKNQGNQGIGYNRNKLLDWFYSAEPVADTDFVLFVDGDDILAPDHMANKLALFAREPELEVVGGQLELFYPDGSVNVVDTFSTDPDLVDIAGVFECHAYAANALFRGSVFRPSSRRFQPVTTSEDWLFFAENGLLMKHIPQVTLRYRRHDNNVTQSLCTAQSLANRWAAHRLGAARMGLALSDVDCRLIDLVGYQTFRSRWHGGVPLASAAHMPWFNYLHTQAEVIRQWPELRLALANLFARMVECNATTTGYHPKKLEAFLSNLLTLSDQELA